MKGMSPTRHTTARDGQRGPVLAFPAWYRPSKWDLEVDPQLVLPLRERFRRAEAAEKASHVAQGLAVRRRNRERKAAAAGVPRPPPSKEERRLAGKLGGLRARARHDPKEGLAAARTAAEARFEQEVDPDLILPPEERRRRARAARAAHFTLLCLASLEARPLRADRADEAQRSATRRRLKARVGGFRAQSRHDSQELTVRAREVNELRWRERVDPAGTLGEGELAEAIRQAKSEHFRELGRQRSSRNPNREREELRRGDPEQPPSGGT